MDDQPAGLGALLDALGAAGYRLLIAEGGEAALQLLERERPDLVLLDVVMPGLDGFATCRRLKEGPAGRDLPVLFMTALDDPDEKVRAFGAGAADYITKPAYVPEVLARVGAHLRIAALQRSLARKNAQLESEIELRVEAENQLSAALDRAVVVATPEGRVTFCTRLATALLARRFPGWTPGRLPEALRQLGAVGSPLTPRGGGDCEGLVVRRFVQAGSDDLVILTLEEKLPAPSPAALQQLGLTPREAEVLFWIAQGKGNPEIAVILSMSVRTVYKHVEHIFEKLGVESRHAAGLAAAEVLRASSP